MIQIINDILFFLRLADHELHLRDCEIQKIRYIFLYQDALELLVIIYSEFSGAYYNRQKQIYTIFMITQSYNTEIQCYCRNKFILQEFCCFLVLQKQFYYHEFQITSPKLNYKLPVYDPYWSQDSKLPLNTIIGQKTFRGRNSIQQQYFQYHQLIHLIRIHYLFYTQLLTKTTMNINQQQPHNLEQAIRLNREIAYRISNLRAKCFDYKVIGPIELSQRSNKTRPPTPQKQTFHTLLTLSPEEKQLIIKELSCRLNIQGLTIQQFLTGRTEITQKQLILILKNKLKYPNQYTARRAARFIFQTTVFDTEQTRQVDDIIFEIKGRLECSSYSRATGKQMFEKLGLKIRNAFYHKIMNKKQIDYYMLSQLLNSEGLDLYETNQLLSYVLQSSHSSNFHHFQLKSMLIKQEDDGNKKKDKYQKKESILTKSSQNRERQNSSDRIRGDQISFLDCQIEVIEEHQPHLCRVYDYDS